jgi:predicted membrane channel-forming protein YqfA (hemolysin III family)
MKHSTVVSTGGDTRDGRTSCKGRNSAGRSRSPLRYSRIQSPSRREQQQAVCEMRRWQVLTPSDVSEMRVVELREELKKRGLKFTSKDLKPALAKMLLQHLEDKERANTPWRTKGVKNQIIQLAVEENGHDFCDVVLPDIDATHGTSPALSSFSLVNPDAIQFDNESQDDRSSCTSEERVGPSPSGFITPRTLDLSEKIRSLEESIAEGQKEAGGLVSFFFLYQWGPRDETVHDCYQKFYIDYGYRPVYSFKDAITSLFSWHNETMNIWSHLIGFACTFIAVAKFAMDLYSYDKETYSAERLVLGGYITCASLCLLFSTLYHWFCCLSPDAADSLLRIDLTGIALLIGSSYFPVSYFGFYCTPMLQTGYLGMSTLVLTLSLVSPWVEATWFGVPAKTIMMASLAGVGIIPFTHWMLITPSFYIQSIAPGNSCVQHFCGFAECILTPGVS